MQLLEWDGRPLDWHRAEIRANAQVETGARVPRRWPTDRLIVNTGQQLHTRLARCDHMRAALDKSPVVRAVSSRSAESPKEMLGLRCITCQRMVNRFDSSSHIQINADSSIDLQFTTTLSAAHAAAGRLYDTASPTREQLSSSSVASLKQQGHRIIPLEPFRFNGPCTVRLVERFPTLGELNEIPLASRLLRKGEAGEGNGWVCTNSSCDPAVVNATELCGSCSTHRSWIERGQQAAHKQCSGSLNRKEGRQEMY